MPVVEVRGLKINYEIIGDSGPWFALMPGGRRRYQEILPLAKKIALEGFRVVLHDRRNTGASEISLTADQTEETVWADDLHELLTQLGALPAFIGGSSSGARTSILFCLRNAKDIKGLLLMRVTGGAFAVNRLSENYYGQYIREAKAGGMSRVCQTEAYRERIEANPANEKTLMDIEPKEFVSIMSRLRELFVAGGELPVLGVSEKELKSISTPTIIIPGNDKTHALYTAKIAHEMIPNSQLHQLPTPYQDVDIIPFGDWEQFEPEITKVFTDFMRRIGSDS